MGTDRTEPAGGLLTQEGDHPVGDIDAYWQGGFHNVEGWVFGELLDYLKCVDRFQQEAKVAGNICEIGVHHGRFLIALSHLARPNEKCVAIDIFEDQAANIDGSGRGSLIQLRDNVDRFAASGARFEYIQADSLALTAGERLAIEQQHGPFRVFSIDGGHTVDHTLNDLVFAQSVISPGGIIILDDYYNQHWPGVHEGVGIFYSRGVSTVKPFLYAQNKLFLCGISVHERYLRWCCDQFRDRWGFKIVKMYNSDAMVVSSAPST
jgi:hypothetical protein